MRMAMGVVGLVSLAMGCGGAEVGTPKLPSATVVGYEIAARDGAPLQLEAGGALALKVVAHLSDGSQRDLDADAGVTWTSPATVDARTDGAARDDLPGPFPEPGDAPSAVFVTNRGRGEHRDDLDGVLFGLDPGVRNEPLQVVAQVPGAGAVAAAIRVSPMPDGDPARGEQRYGPGGFDCAACHGDHGEGGSGPPLDLGDDPTWTAPVFGLAVRADVDNEGVGLRAPMPDFLRLTDRSGRALSAQDAADLWAFLQPQD